MYMYNADGARFTDVSCCSGCCRYFFKKPSDDFDTGIVYEEVKSDVESLPLMDGKIIGRVEKIE